MSEYQRRAAVIEDFLLSAASLRDDAASRQTWTLNPARLLIQGAAATVWTLASIRSVRHHQSCSPSHYCSAQVRAPRLPRHAPSAARLAGRHFRGRRGESNQRGIAEGSTARGDSSSSVVTKSHHNQTEETECFCHPGRRHNTC